MADRICLLPVYDVAGRETKKARASVDSKKLAHELLKRGKDAYHFNSSSEAKEFITAEVHPKDIVLVMGAGDIYDLAKELTLGH